MQREYFCPNTLAKCRIQPALSDTSYGETLILLYRVGLSRKRFISNGREFFSHFGENVTKKENKVFFENSFFV